MLRAVIALNSHLLELALHGEGANPINEAALGKLVKRENPVMLDARFAGRNPIPAGFSQSLPGTLVMFVMMNLLIFGGASIASERANGLIKRLAVYPIRRWELVIGKVYGRFLLGCAQIIFLLLAGKFVFHVNVGQSLLGVLLTMFLYAWVAASLGVLIGSLVVSAEKTVGICVLSANLMAALGGCWWPLEIVPDTMKTIGHLFPSAWAMDTLHQLISFGGGVGEIVPKLAVLALFAVAANIAAAKAFRY